MGERRGTKALETWCKRVTQGYPGVKVENMTTSWRDGMAFCAMIHHFRPDLIDFSSLDKSDILRNNEMAFRIAERHLGIPALLDAEDMAEYPVPDRLSILTYLSQFYQAFASNSASPIKKQTVDSPDTSLTSLSQSSVQHNPKLEGAPPWKEPCVVCDHAVFLAQRLRVEGKLYHRTCFRCARCNAQLSTADYYETHDGQYCCETCPDEVMEDKPQLQIQVVPIIEEPDEPVIKRTRPQSAEPSPSHKSSLVAMRKMLFDSYDKDTDDAKLTRCETLTTEVVNNLADSKNDLSNNDDSSSQVQFINKDSEGDVYNVDDKITNSPLCVELTHTDSKCNDSDLDVNLSINRADGEDSDKLTEPDRVDLQEDDKSLPLSDNSITVHTENDLKIKKDEAFTEAPKTENISGNPFGDEDEEEEVEISKTSTNPFGSDSEDEIELKSSTPIKSPRSKELQLSPIRKAPSQNPFDSDEDDEPQPPVPLPRRSAQPSPVPFPRGKLRGSQRSLASMSSMGSYTSPRKKKPAPPPPVSPYNTLTSPRSRKTRRAPQPPGLNSSRLSLNSDVSKMSDDSQSVCDKDLQGEDIAHEISNIAEQISHMVSKDEEVEVSRKSPVGEEVAVSRKNSFNTPEVAVSRKNSVNKDPAEVALSRKNSINNTTEVAVSRKNSINNTTEVAVSRKNSINREDVSRQNSINAEDVAIIKESEEVGLNKDVPEDSNEVENTEASEINEAVNLEIQKKYIPLTPPPKPRRLEISSTEISLHSTSPTPSASTSNVDSLTYQEDLSPPTEKENKDSANLHRKISEERGAIYAMPKSAHGQWRRKKAPAPPLPLPKRRTVKPMPIQNIKQELTDIEIKQQGLERQGVALENKIRDKFDTEASITPYVEELVLQLFELVNEKNELFRKQAELMYLRRQHHLEEEHAELEYQIRCLMARPEVNKTDSDKETEEQLIQRLVEVVERRDAIVQCLEMDRLREAEEDKSINSSLAITQETQPKTSKKHKKKKDKQNTLKTLDLDKDLDESEKDVKKKKKWYTLHHLKNKHL